MLIQGFNTFLPPGYRIECGTDDNPNAIRVTTPQGSRLTSMQPRPLQGDPLGLPGTSLQQLHERDRQMWTQPLAIQHADALSPNGRMGGPGLFNQQSAPSQESQMDYQQTEQANSAAALAHQQEQRGVSQLQNAVSAATNGTPSRPSMMQVSPGSGQPANLAQPVSGLSAINSGTMTPGQVGLEKRGPVEFNHAISYVNKIKVSGRGNRENSPFWSLW
jgi:paired amphipathic helix protein Sin3a